KFRSIYISEKLKEIGHWKNGQLPKSFVIPKFKDPPNKSRLICSYYQHCLKDVFRNLSFALTWAFLQLKGKAKTFNLYRLDELLKNLKEARSWIKGTYKETNILTLQS